MRAKIALSLVFLRIIFLLSYAVPLDPLLSLPLLIQIFIKCALIKGTRFVFGQASSDDYWPLWRFISNELLTTCNQNSPNRNWCKKIAMLNYFIFHVSFPKVI